MSRGRPGTRQQREESYDIDIGIPADSMARFEAAREFLEIAACQPMKDGVIQAFADAAAEAFRNMQIDGLKFDDDKDYRFDKG